MDIPQGQMIGICGLSGSGKTSLALDTLHAEGQRRYIECFSPQARQFLGQLERPDADQIEAVPPAIAISAWKGNRGSRSTVGTLTETLDYLRLIYSKLADPVCNQCNRIVKPSSQQSIAEWILSLDEDARFQIGFSVPIQGEEQAREVIQEQIRNGFVRGYLDHRSFDLSSFEPPHPWPSEWDSLDVIIDRLKSANIDGKRLNDSVEIALSAGHGKCVVILRDQNGKDVRHLFSTQRHCTGCSASFPEPEPALFSFNSTTGACHTCEGFGNVAELDHSKIFPNPKLSIREGGIAPWNTPAYEHECDELIELASDYDIDVDLPLSELSDAQRSLIWEGVAEREFGGLNGFFAWLEKGRYKLPIRVFLNRWKSDRVCPDCNGLRLNPTSLAFRIRDLNIADVSLLPITKVIEFLNDVSDDPEANQSSNREAVQELSRRVVGRLQYLQGVGLDYLNLARTITTLSRGEVQRVALTRALGSTLVNLMYVLDEPSVGLHPADVEQLIPWLKKLHHSQNTLVIVEHDRSILESCERMIEIGPGAGASGGLVVYDGSPEEIGLEEESITGQFYSGRRGLSFYGEDRRSCSHGHIRLTGCSGNNLKNLTVEFPLGVLCVVTGVSGSGKSSLVGETLGPALLQRIRDTKSDVLPFGSMTGDGKIDDVVIIDQSQLTKTSRSNPVTYVKAFDEIRNVFADTVDARTRNLKPGHFSFNVDGGRCEKCKGDGFVTIDMQFLADVNKRCELCQGNRFKPDVLAVKYRDRNIKDVLDMTVRQAFSFFRGHKKVQSKLKLLSDVGLDYVPLGQSLSTLSNGESQRLRLASHLGSATKKRTLFLLDEPTGGLHMADVVRLVDCFNSLIAVGHSVIVVEHDLQVILHADYVIEMGPGPAENGGQVVAEGAPEEISEVAESQTGRFLKRELDRASAMRR